MNYDRIILELLDRVSALEDEVKKLKEERTSAAQEITRKKMNLLSAAVEGIRPSICWTEKGMQKTDLCLPWSRSIWKCILIFQPLS